MKKLAVLMSMAMARLGIKEFARDKDNKIVLSDDDRATLEKHYGKETIEKMLAIENGVVEATEENTQDVFSAMVKHISAEEKQKLEAEKADLQTKLTAAEADKTTLLSEKQQLEADLRENQAKLAILAAMPEPLPQAQKTQTGFFGEKKKYAKGDTIMKVNADASHYASIFKASESGVPVLAGDATIDVAELQREFGAFLGQNGQQFRVEIYNTILTGFTSAEHFTSQLAENEYRASQALMTSVMQQFKPKWTPLGNAKFAPITIKNRRHKINVPIVPAEVLDSYLSFLYDEQLAPDQMPITKYIIEKLIMPGLLFDIENRAIFKGKFEEVEYDANGKVTKGGTPETSMDGIETILVQNLTNASSGINYYPASKVKTIAQLSAMNAEDRVAYFTNFAQWISQAYPVEKIFCSQEMFFLYETAYKKLWAAGSGVIDSKFGKGTIDFTNKVLTPLDGMAGSPILYATPKLNKLKLRWKNEAPFVINDVQKHGYEVWIFGQFSLAAGFAVGDAVFAAVPSDYKPWELVTSQLGAATDFQRGLRGEQDAIVTLTTAAGTDAQSVEEGAAIEPIAYTFKGSSASVTGLPDGITATIAGNAIVISGTPTATGVSTFTVKVIGISGGADATANGKITVTEQGL